MQNNDETDYYTSSPDRPFYIDMTVDGKTRRIWVTKEHFHAYWKDYNAERDRVERESRCLVKSEAGGLKRCCLDCSQCPYSNAGHRMGSPASPEFLKEEYGMEIQGDDDPVVHYEATEREEAVRRELSLLPVNDSKILRLRYWEGLSTADIAKAVGMSQTGAARRLRTLEETLRKRLAAFRK